MNLPTLAEILDAEDVQDAHAQDRENRPAPKRDNSAYSTVRIHKATAKRLENLRKTWEAWARKETLPKGWGRKTLVSLEDVILGLLDEYQGERRPMVRGEIP